MLSPATSARGMLAPSWVLVGPRDDRCHQPAWQRPIATAHSEQRRSLGASDGGAAARLSERLLGAAARARQGPETALCASRDSCNRCRKRACTASRLSSRSSSNAIASVPPQAPLHLARGGARTSGIGCVELATT